MHDEFDSLLCILDRPVTVTRFPTIGAGRKTERQISIRELAHEIRRTKASSKEELPWFKLACFGDQRTEKGSLRHNANVIAVSGVEADYDAGEMSLAEAERRLRDADVAAMLYTTAKHTEEAPRWRVFAPFASSRAPEVRTRFMERLNGIMDGTLDGASFTLSQSYYGGNVTGRPTIVVRLIDGRAIDLADNLDAIALSKGQCRNNGKEAPKSDSSGSGSLYALAASVKRDDGTVDTLKAALSLPENAAAAAHVAKEEEAGKGRGERAINRAWKAAPAVSADDFDDDLEPPPSTSSDDELASLLHGIPGSVESFPLTEDGVARAFAKRFRDDLRFCHTAGSWYRWENSHWRREETKLAFEWARQTCRRHAVDNPKSAAAKAMSRASSAGGVERFAQADRAFAVTAAAWDRDLWLLGTPGGTVELRTGEIRPASPADMITRLTAATPIPLADFKPSRDCPRWLAFLDDATGTDADAIRFIQQWAGYSLTGDTREEALLFVHGPGGSGKSTAINTLADVMGDYAVNVAAETITASKWDRHSTELARLHNARMARASETEAGRAWAESRLKALTGGDKITARFMRCDDFEFKPAFKLTIIGNHAPRIVNVDEAMRRRFNVLPFTHPPQRADSSLKDALQAEWPAILSWAMLGCLDWQRQGLTRPAVVVQATEAYFADQDTFALWLDECCEVGKGFSATTANLSLSFRSFALRAGDETPMGSKGFSQLMQARGFQPIKDALGMRGRGFAGLRLRNDFNEECEAQGV